MKTLSGNAAIDGLLETYDPLLHPVLTWHTGNGLGGPVSLTYSFLTNATDGVSGFAAMNTDLQNAAAEAMQEFSNVANITFTAGTGQTDLSYGTADFGGSVFGYTAGIAYSGFSYYTGFYGWFTGSNVYLTNADFVGYTSAPQGSEAYEVLLHEIAHALGLKHSFESPSVPTGTDTSQYTVMSYTAGYSSPAAGLQLYDIMALQYLYGANTSYNDTDTTILLSDFLSDGPQALWDGGGVDTISLADQTLGMELFLEHSKFSTFYLTNDFVIAPNANIENAIGSSGHDTIWGNDLVNNLKGGDGNDKLYGGIGDDTLYGQSGSDELHGDEGDDRIYSGSGTDKVYLGDGNDYVKVGGGVEEFYGGDGNDYISYYNSSGGVNINLETNEVSGSWAVNDTISGFESISGSKTGGDKIYGTSGANTIKTYGGDDKVYAGKGSDNVYLGDGDDYVRVGGGVEEFYGGDGNDWISYYGSTGGIRINLATDEISGSWAVNDTISGFEDFSGSKNGGDHVTGTSGANTIKTYGGDDRVYAGKGSDVVELGSGDDYVRVGGGEESFDGGSGVDYISYYDSTGGITIDLEADTVSGSWAVNDTIKNFESASGSGKGGDKMYGTSGANTLKGFGGNDKLYGRSGDDTLYGGSGADRFDGGAGTDILYGGSDADIFHFDHGEDHDIIKDFEDDVDTIQLDNFGYADATEALTYATESNGNVIFDFGGGDMLTIENVTKAQLFNDLEIV